MHKNLSKKKSELIIDIGWREWISIIGFNSFFLKAKIDTGASISALHATHIKQYEHDGLKYVNFRTYFGQK